MDAREAVQARARWRLVEQRLQQELRATTPETKLRQVAALMMSVDAMGWRAQLEDGDDFVRRRWQALRRHYGVA